MRNTVETIIEPDYEGDHTESWKDKTHPDIFPAVYKRYRAPANEQECAQMVSDLSALIVLINDQYNDARNEAVKLGMDPARDIPTKDKLKTIRSARNRYEAVRKAYIHWGASESGPSIVKTIGKTQYNTNDRLNALADGLKKITDLLIADFNGEEADDKLLSELVLLRKQLEVVFVSAE